MERESLDMFRLQILLGYLRQRSDLWLLSIILFLSFFSFLTASTLNLVTAYNDSMSHLNLTRLIIDNQEPGISQLGGVWLPLNHILPLLFIWNDYLWHTGFAGSVFSMAAFILSTVFIHKSIWLLTAKKTASIIGGFVFAFNLNILYLQSTPLTETLYLLFFIASVYFALEWIISQKPRSLPLIGFFGFLQVLTRYDGWFVAGLEVAILFIFEFIYNKKSIAESLSKMLLVSIPIAFGIGIWLLWNLLIFGDPLFFALGPYSAHAQQAVINNSSPLITKGDWAISIKAYYYTIINNVGLLTTTLGIFGASYFFISKNRISSIGVRGLVFLLFITPIIFNILALYLGFSILNIPDLNWKPRDDESALWFNVRYGILALPAIAMWVGMLSTAEVYLWFRKRRLILYPLTLIAVFVVLLQMYITFNEGIITVIDGTRGSSSYVNSDISDYLKTQVKEDDRVLLAVSYFNPVAFQSQIELKQVIHEGVSQKWSKALAAPQVYADWIVMSSGKVGEPVYDQLVDKDNSNFLNFYTLVYRGHHANVYKLNSKQWEAAR